MHIQNRKRIFSTRSRSGPSAEGMGARVAFWVAAAVGLALALNATGVRFPIVVDPPAATPSD